MPGTELDVPLRQWLRRAGASLRTLMHSQAMKTLQLDVAPDTGALDIESVETAVRFAGYLRRQTEQVARLRNRLGRAIPPTFSYCGLAGLSREATQRLEEVRPETLDQASRVSGVTPAAVAILAAHLDKQMTGQPDAT